MHLGISQGTPGSYPQVSIDSVLKAVEVLVNGVLVDKIWVSKLHCGWRNSHWTTPKENKVILESQRAIYFRKISECEHGKTT